MSCHAVVGRRRTWRGDDGGAGGKDGERRRAREGEGEIVKFDDCFVRTERRRNCGHLKSNHLMHAYVSTHIRNRISWCMWFPRSLHTWKSLFWMSKYVKCTSLEKVRVAPSSNADVPS